ncbi:MAG: NADH-quinone oxidoreductase subunit NuoH [Candidatus Hydrothermales bacterium]
MIGTILLTIIYVFVALFIVLYITWIERKFAARLHNRVGPYYVGRPHGFLQPFADVLKLLLKEDIVPEQADKKIFNIAPIIVFVGALLTFPVLPVAKNIYISDLSVGLIYFFAVSSLMVFGVFLAGWASNSKYALLSAFRAGAQVVSYEIPLILSALIPVVLAGSLRTNDIVQAQKVPFALYPVFGWVAFIIFVISGLAEENKVPFDVPEAESELVAAYNVEYSGMKFALFYAAEYVHILALSVLGSILFLGGYRGFYPTFGPEWLYQIFWLLFKTFIMLILFLLVRWSFVRIRIDRLIIFSWKYLFPISLINLFLASLWKLLF